jgi:hypothetical protein
MNDFDSHRIARLRAELGALHNRADELGLALARLEPAWSPLAPLGAIHSRLRDLDTWLASVFDEVPTAPLEDDHAMLFHDVYLRVIALAQMLRRAAVQRWAAPDDLVDASVAVDAVLDAFAPFICLADAALRRVVLDGEPLEVALASIEHELRA